ncbi:hypothetical protein GGX14DRAFT_648403, partial [Mycena pura]
MSASDFLPLLTSLPPSGAATNAIVAVFALIITTLFIHCASPMRLTDVLVIAMDETEKTYVDAFEMGVRPMFDHGIAKTMIRYGSLIQVSDIRAASLRNSLSYRSGLWQFLKGRTFTLLCCIWEVQSLKTHIEKSTCAPDTLSADTEPPRRWEILFDDAKSTSFQGFSTASIDIFFPPTYFIILLSFKYEPETLRRVVFPADAEDEELRERQESRKRRRLSGLEEVYAAAAGMEDGTVPENQEKVKEEGEREEGEAMEEDTEGERARERRERDRKRAPDPDATPTKASFRRAAHKPRDVRLETTGGTYVFSRAAVEGDGVNARWDVARVRADGGWTLLYRALGADAVEFGTAGVRFRPTLVDDDGTKTPKSQSPEEGEVQETLSMNVEEQRAVAAGDATVGVVLWRYG